MRFVNKSKPGKYQNLKKNIDKSKMKMINYSKLLKMYSLVKIKTILVDSSSTRAIKNLLEDRIICQFLVSII